MFRLHKLEISLYRHIILLDLRKKKTGHNNNNNNDDAKVVKEAKECAK